MRGFLRNALMIWGAALSSLTAARPLAAAGASATKPANLIFLRTDDQGYGDLSCHGSPPPQDAEPRSAPILSTA
ncbi:MAG TPA: hypothetical protein VH643_31445 [Gemmataceae bacterium]|jgi:hypothetical protein